ncbi:hypothetical protein EBN03_05685 [Nocardia stercoris]|uniref:Uncharacterized protein n=1 Tax=Nocardia stercoris TaxID=2483361 RepID=A0A3M2LAA4_9NOCA|nr:hypothetical protein EBN03_05685 [Nocardia stercoris]
MGSRAGLELSRVLRSTNRRPRAGRASILPGGASHRGGDPGAFADQDRRERVESAARWDGGGAGRDASDST